jgi:hypothetical protein
MITSGATATGRHRQIFYDNSKQKAVDVCVGKLKMSHVIDFSGRLELNPQTVPLAELLLLKLQIVNMSEKDLQDAVILLCTYDVGQNDDVISFAQVAKTLAGDWGFYHTATTNLCRIVEYAASHHALSKPNKAAIAKRVHKLINAIHAEPKTLKWRLRAKIGTAVKWYNQVEESQR